MDRRYVKPDAARLNPEDPYLPFHRGGFESLIIRQWRSQLEDRHMAAEGYASFPQRRPRPDPIVFDADIITEIQQWMGDTPDILEAHHFTVSPEGES